MSEDFERALDRAIAVATAHERELLAVPGVVAVGAGPERKAGRPTGHAAVVVTVRAKRGRRELEAAGERLLPNRLGGVPVDVVELGAPVEAPEIVAAQVKAREVLDRVRDDWLRTPNVTGLGVGYKRVGGEPDFRTIALQIFVAEKLTPAELRDRGLPVVPATIEGVPTDVQALPPMRPTSSASGSRDDRKDPLVGGATVGVNTKPFWYGTLGATVFDRTSGEQMVLSNQHVLDGPPGTDVVQPSPIGLDDSLDIGFQLDFCNPLHFFRLDTPNTTVGSVLAGAAAAAALAAALSDQIDPTRRGQEATVPPPGAKTLAESHEVRLGYPELPIPGTRFDVKADWRYTRHTDAGDMSVSVNETRTNEHVLDDKVLLTDRLLYNPGDTILLFGCVLPAPCAPPDGTPGVHDPIRPAELRALRDAAAFEPPPLSAARAARSYPEPRSALARFCACHRYHVTALLWPTSVDRAFPVVLRRPVLARATEVINRLAEVLAQRDDQELFERVVRILRYGCLYVGELGAGALPLGPWKHLLFVQTVNDSTLNMKPTQAAQIIGGLPVSQNTTPQVDVACGPVVFEDGQFDIELI